MEKSKKKIQEKKLLFKNKIKFYPCDITNEKEVSKIISAIKKKNNSIDVLINNACVNLSPIKKNKKKNDFINFSLKQFDEELNVGLKGAVICCKIVGKHMIKQKRGNIVNIGSDLSIIAPDQRLYKHMNISKPVTYSIIKAGIHGLTIYLASLWASKGIRVNTLSPGGIYNKQDKIFIKKIKKLIPIGRMAKLDEYNKAIQFLCDDGSKYMNGHNLVIDGGRTII